MEWFYLLFGALLGASVAATGVYWQAQRHILRARRLVERVRLRENLLEMVKLIGWLAHEIRNPLSTIKLNLRLLAEEFEHSGDDLHRRNYNRLQRVQEEVQRVHDILNDFQKYTGQKSLERGQADLRRVVEELVDFYRPQAEGNRVVLRATMPEAPVPCRLDLGLIKQAILNLMINATQAMSEGGELILRLSTQQDRAVLEVTDTGPGIPPENLGRIFEAYFSTRLGGSGLGLPATRRLVRMHDGEVQVHSELGKGTRFTVSLPLATGEKAKE